MRTISRDDVPDILKDSELYQNIIIPEKYNIKSDFAIESFSDLGKLIISLKYWRINTIPVQIYKFVDLRLNLENEDTNNSNFMALQFMLGASSFSKINVFCRVTDINQARLYVKYKLGKISIDEMTKEISTKNYKSLLTCLIGDDFQFTKSFYYNLIKCNNYEMLEYAILNDRHSLKATDVYQSHWDYSLFNYTIKKDCFSCLDVLMKYICILDDKKFVIKRILIKRSFVETAIRFNKLNLLKYFIDICKYQLHEDAIRVASACGHLEIVHYLFDNNCPINQVEFNPNTSGLSNSIGYAIKNKHWDIAKYLFFKNFKPSISIIIWLVLVGEIEMIRFFIDNGYDMKFGKDKTSFFCDLAVKMNNKKTFLFFLGQTGHVIGTSSTAVAAAYGKLEMLKYLREVLNCPWDSQTCDLAFQYEEFECFQYAYDNDCPWSNLTKNKRESKKVKRKSKNKKYLDYAYSRLNGSE